MLWWFLGIVAVAILAYAMRKATRGTPFVNSCGCTPNIDHLRWVEKGEKREDKKRENLW